MPKTFQRVPRRRYHICGAAGTIEWDLQDKAVRLHLPGEPDAEIVPTPEDLNDMYVAQAQWTLDALKAGDPPVTGIDQALAVLRLQMQWRTRTINA